MADGLTAQKQPALKVSLRGGSPQEQTIITDVLDAADIVVAVEDADPALLPSVEILQDDPQVFANAVNWDQFAEGILQSSEIETAAFFLVNLDHFQRIRSIIGPAVADNLLRAVADCLLAQLEGILDARFLHVGGDEFALLIPHLGDEVAAAAFADSLLQAVSRSYEDVAPQAYVSARVGVVLYPQDGGDIGALVKHASSAIHHETREGRNSVQFYTRGMAALAAERFRLEADLYQAIRNDELEVYYQPQISFSSGRIVGAEALVRWNRPGLGVVPADVFVALAENLGLITDLGTWVLTTAAAQCCAWQQPGQRPVQVSINASSYQFRRLDMTAVVGRALEQSGLDPDHLVLEITESQVMLNVEQNLQSLKQLRRMGVHIALDDFGTGYSSLSYLKTLALDSLKIDRSFVAGLPDDPGDFAVTEATIRMARALNLSVTAEGVETEAQRACLERFGCDSYQGFLASQPVPAHEFAKLLADQRAN